MLDSCKSELELGTIIAILKKTNFHASVIRIHYHKIFYQMHLNKY